MSLYFGGKAYIASSLFIFIMDIERSPLQETLELIEQRVNFFATKRLSAENALTSPLPNINLSVRSLSQIVPQLASYELNSTPFHLNLADIYLGKEAVKNQFENCQVKFLLPPVSEGEDSITEDDDFEPSFKWISNAIIDSSYLLTDKVQPKKVERGKAPPDWKGINQLLLYNVDRKIYSRPEMIEFEDHLKGRFQKFPWIKIKKIKEVYYKGKPSILLRFIDEISSSFAYFNLATATQKDFIGQHCEVLRITDNKLKQKLASEVTIVFRKLPLNMTKQSFLAIFKKTAPTWMEELIQICGFKYTICKVSYLDDAFSIVSDFNAKNIKQAKVNYHPKSAKTWKAAEQIYFEGTK